MLHAILRWLTGRELAASIAGDLAEERARRALASPARARFWHARALLAVALFALLERASGAALAVAAAIGRGVRPGGAGEWCQALRAVSRAPWYSVLVIGVIALSITLATTVFAIVDGVLFKPLPYPRADQLYTMSPPFSLAASAREIREWAEAVPESKMVAVQGTFVIGSIGAARPAPVRAVVVGPGFFDVLGVSPLIGGFSPTHFEPTGGRRPALISYGLWQRQFGGATDIVGQPFDVVGAVDHVRAPIPGVEVVGVLRRDFVFPSSDTPEVILPIALTPERELDRNWSPSYPLVRVPDHLMPADVARRASEVAEAQGFKQSANSPNPPSPPDVRIRPLSEEMRVSRQSGFQSAFDVALVLVALAGVNIGALTLARCRRRSAEFALRRALGASQWRLRQGALFEVLPLVLSGTLLGLVASNALVPAIVAVMPPSTALLKPIGMDWRVAAFAGGVSGLIAVCVALFSQPAARRLRLRESLAAGPAAALGRERWGTLAVASQTALAVVLCLGATLQVASLWQAQQAHPGFDPRGVVMVSLTLGSGAQAERAARLRLVEQRVSQSPGVGFSATVQARLLDNGSLSPPVIPPAGRQRGNAALVGLGHGDFFEVLGIRPIDGRLPTAAEVAANARVAVVSELIAENFWPGARAVGQVLETREFGFDVIGVVPDARFVNQDRPSGGQIYWPSSVAGAFTYLVARGPGGEARTLLSVMDAVRSVGEPVGVTRAATMPEAIGESIRHRTYHAWLYGGFGGASLLIVAVGVFGIAAASSARRRREFCIRAALGATSHRIIRLTLRRYLAAVLIGLFAGGMAAWWTVGYLRLSLYQVSKYDPGLWAFALAVLLGSAACGALVPALRASRVDPIQALRAE